MKLMLVCSCHFVIRFILMYTTSSNSSRKTERHMYKQQNVPVTNKQTINDAPYQGLMQGLGELLDSLE